MTDAGAGPSVGGAFAVPGPAVPLAEMFDFSGRVAVVTGGGRGIGEAICRRLAGAGASLLVVDADGDGASRVASELDSASCRAMAVSGDIRQREVAGRAVAAACDELGGLHVMVNCAGIYPSGGVLEMTERHWDEVMDTNLKAMFIWSQEAARAMVRSGKGGVIVNISSRAGIRARPGKAAYSASKAGVLLLTQSLALELADHGIRVNAVAPGPVGPSDLQPTEWQAGYMARIPARRFAEADEVALAVVFLASPASSFITGSTLVVDGGAIIP